MTYAQGLDWRSNFGYLTINGVLMHNPAFCVDERDLLQLWTRGGMRGENARIPRKAGTLKRRRVSDEKQYQLRIYVVGTVSRAGVLIGSPGSPAAYAAAQATVDYLNANVVLPDDGSVQAFAGSYLKADGTTTLTGDVQPTQLRFGYDETDRLQGVLDVTIPRGRFL